MSSDCSHTYLLRCTGGRTVRVAASRHVYTPLELSTMLRTLAQSVVSAVQPVKDRGYGG
jgi:hypothetical protein